MTQGLYHKRELTLFATLLYVTNVAFILHARQCRYYALIFLAQICLLYGYQRLLVGRSRPGILCVVLAFAVVFYCNYVLMLPSLFAMIIPTLVVRRRGLFRNLLVCMAIIFLLAIPWMIYAQRGPKQDVLEFRTGAGRGGDAAVPTSTSMA
jgi:hypothetical protein